MLIFAGLGNPGARYARNRHNIGFMALDAIARAHRASPWRGRFQAEACEATIGTEKVVLLKPQTYMNESGRAIGEAARFFKVAPADVVVFHDELDLAPAKLRVKLGGGNAGHNGLRSTTAAIGNDYRRVRMGIGHPGLKELVHAYVLNDFGKAEGAWVEDLCTACADNAELLAKHDDAGFQNKVHLFMEAHRHGAVKRLGEKTD
ncbi:MAG TPA: aminoacyl-tRNA hydrolase [Bosea sp. (in: a-proteobacteria)]|jgi:PTH1 family peptidyl-tRNA hydrolase|uniref:aminoacyl-tRNA hydrolase n=1 Tax=Bosea sp. (in: a-proteobacteria) TaxID=1871050 RepID=UPI002DDD4C69|nr:aminoacyl-tRNA hydrolase [Bosea sp. (in: a-proteobacteria)]HEV2552842.1 aminoacyl-tRNA hydrolase [Bosea sp. (in: a-proteobacteria)]